MNKILEKLKQDVPEFYNNQEFSYVLSIDFDRLGEYINKLLIELFIDEKLENKLILKKIFTFLNELFNPDIQDIYNLISVSIFELLIETKYGYGIAKNYMSKEMYMFFIKEYPYEDYKDSWDTENYYTEEDYQRILNLPDINDEN